ncbi:MAG: hypothetical protein ACLRFO_02020 [Alphaproteobacteria bacterium]
MTFPEATKKLNQKMDVADIIVKHFIDKLPTLRVYNQSFTDPQQRQKDGVNSIVNTFYIYGSDSEDIRLHIQIFENGEIGSTGFFMPIRIVKKIFGADYPTDYSDATKDNPFNTNPNYREAVDSCVVNAVSDDAKKEIIKVLGKKGFELAYYVKTISVEDFLQKKKNAVVNTQQKDTSR